MKEFLTLYAPFLNIIFLFFQGLLTWLIWSMKKEFASNSDMEKVYNRLGKLESAGHVCTSLAEIKENQKAIQQLYLSAANLTGNIEAMSERIKGVNDILMRVEKILDRQEDFLLNTKGNRK